MVVIVVDDCELIKMSLSKILPHSEDTVQFYDNLSDVLQMLKQIKGMERLFFVVDLELVGPNGVDELISLMPKDHSHLVLLTSLPYTYVEKEAKRPEILKLFTKPFNLNELADIIIQADNKSR
jgi:FixJ family two-component response regulator